MLKRLILIGLFSALLSGCSLVPQKAGIEIISNPSAKVFIDNKESGMTPYKNNSLVPGEVTVKLQTTDNQHELVKKIELQNKTTTVISWNFGETDEQSGGYVLLMEKTGDKNRSSLLVNATPDKSEVTIDDEIKGYSPTKIDDIGENDKHIIISFPGYKSTNLYVKAIKNYQLLVDAKLAIEAPLVTETAVASATPEIANVTKVKIKSTETGWLKVREKSNSSSAEVAKVKPEETYVLLGEENSWYKIDLTNGKSGWISAKYAEKLSPQ